MEPANKNPELIASRILASRVIAPAGERAATAPREYAISTETYCEQDGWVLRADGMSLHSAILPILYDHGWDDSLPLGKWGAMRVQGSEIIGTPEWSATLDDEEMKIRSRAEEGLLMTSIRFQIDEWHAPDPMEKNKYNIPESAPYAGIATKWRALEASFVGVPADGNCGPRELATMQARARARRNEMAELRAQNDAMKTLMEKQFAELRASIDNLSKNVAVTQSPAAEVTTSAPAAADGGSHSGNASRSEIYNSERLGTVAATVLKNWRAANKKP